MTFHRIRSRLRQVPFSGRLWRRKMTDRCLRVGLVCIVLFAACKKKAPETDPAARVALLEVGAVPIPDEVLAYGGLKSLDDFTGTLTKIVNAFNPQAAPIIGAQIPSLIQGQLLGVRSLAWLDSKKPFRFIVLDQKKFEVPVALVLPLKGGKEALTAALPDNKAAGAPDNETKYSTLLGNEVFVNVVGEHAVFTLDPKAFAAVKGFVQGDFTRVAFQDLVDVQFSAKNFRRIAGDDLKAMRERMADLSEPKGPIKVPGMQALLKKEIDLLFALLDQADVARLTLSFDDRDLLARASVKVVEGSGLARFVAGTRERKVEIHRALPAGGWFVVAANVDPKAFEGWSRLGLDFYASLLQLNEDEKSRLDSLYAQSIGVQTGESAFFIGRDGDFPFRVVSIGGVTDGEKARALMDEMTAFLLAKVGTLIQKYAAEAPEAVQRLDFSTPKALVEGLKPLLAQNGLALTVRSETIGDMRLDGVEVAVDYSKVPKALRPEEGFERVREIVGEKVSAAVGSDKNRLFAAFGRDAVADIGRLARGEGAVGSQNPLDTSVSRAGFRVAGAGYLSILEALRLVSKLDPSLVEKMPGVQTAQEDVGLTFLIGGHGDRVLDASLTVPLAGIAGLMPKPAPAEAPVAPAP